MSIYIFFGHYIVMQQTFSFDNIRRLFFLVVCALVVLVLFREPLPASDRAGHLEGKRVPLKLSLVLDGSSVHRVGNLQMNVTNWGFFGSLPKSLYDMAESPSAQWPAGSGVEYLYASGLWIGAEKDGIPSVSTAWPETEFYPGSDPLDVIYESSEGVVGGERYAGPGNPYPGICDDDGDGRVDEDWLNGRDDDGDGLVDEDFAAAGQQMFSCWYTDDQPWGSMVWPEHTPLGLQVRQESYQWAESGFDEFIGVRYLVTNVGSSYLSNVYIGIYADVDAGPRIYGSYHMDDLVGYWEGIRCAKKGDVEVPVWVRVAYVYDEDGDGGKTEGYFGIVLLGHTTYIGDMLRSYINLRSFKVFRGLQPFINGGEPTNDYERFEVLSDYGRDGNQISPNDYKVLLSCGPFYYFVPGSSVELDVAFVCGRGLEGMLNSAAQAVFVYDGCYFDKDNDPGTGVIGRETLMHGPLERFDPDPCDENDEKLNLTKLESIWANMDCYFESWFWNYLGCRRGMYATYDDFKTGVDGEEAQLRWITGSAPPSPSIRAVAGNHSVTLYWDNVSETTPDVMTLEDDFEGYEIWRADGWDRPYGSNILTGPAWDLWHFLDTRDIVNGLPPDVDFRQPAAQGGWRYDPLGDLRDRENYTRMFEEALLGSPYDTVPCPPGLSGPVCDTLEALARYRLGLEGGRRYYRYLDKEVKDGMHLFYSVVAYDHEIEKGSPVRPGKHNNPLANFVYVVPESKAQEAVGYREKDVYVVPNPATMENIEPWRLNPNNEDPTGLKIEFRNLPMCLGAVRIFTVSGDLVQVIGFDGRDGSGTLPWDLVSRRGQDVTSGVYIFAVEPEDGRFPRTIGKFVVIR